MKKLTKIAVFLIILAMGLSIMPSKVVNAGVTDNEQNDQGEQQIIRKTTTNYFTTIVLNGSFENEKTGEKDTFTKSTEEFEGNVGSNEFILQKEDLTAAFYNWAIGKGAKEADIKYTNEEIESYYYNAHDEITQSIGNQESNSDVILVGDINDMNKAYEAQGQVTINTILDKHQTYVITAKAKIEDKEIKSINISLTAPTDGDEITVTKKTDPEYGFEYEEADKHPSAVSKTNNISVTFTNWISGTYTEMGDGYDSLLKGYFEKDKYYYAEIGIEATNDFTLGEGLVIKVNDETPAEVFGIYNNNKETHFIAKIKAVEKQAEPQTPEKTEEPKEDAPVQVETETEDETEAKIATESKSNNPQTGDNIVLFVSIFGVAIIGVIATVMISKKH